MSNKNPRDQGKQNSMLPLAVPKTAEQVRRKHLSKWLKVIGGAFALLAFGMQMNQNRNTGGWPSLLLLNHRVLGVPHPCRRFWATGWGTAPGRVPIHAQPHQAWVGSISISAICPVTRT